MSMAEEKGASKKEKKSIAPWRPRRTCPKCGPGRHLAEHANRFSCGRCGYLETKAK